MTDTIFSLQPIATSECPRCAEPLRTAPGEATSCGFCGHVIVPRKPALVRLAEVASLAAALTLIIAVCRVLGHLTGV